MVAERRLSAGEIRQNYIHTHGIALHAIGKVGACLLREYPDTWQRLIEELGLLDWSRHNAKLWEGRAMIGGRVSKAGHNVTLTINLIKSHLGISLTAEEQKVEDAYLRGEHAA